MDLETELRSAFEGAAISLESDGNRVALKIRWSGFAGMSRLQRQQAVYAVLNERIRSGEIHAVHMETKTLEEL